MDRWASNRDLIAHLRCLGVRLTLAGDTINAQAPKGVLTADLAGEMKRRKPGILDALRQEQDAINQRAEAMRESIVNGKLPRELLARVGIEANPGICRSCGDQMMFQQQGKCTLCCLASLQILNGELTKPTGDIAQTAAA